MSQRRLLGALMLLFCTLTLAMSVLEAAARDGMSVQEGDTEGEERKDAKREAAAEKTRKLRELKESKWYVNLPPFLYNMCALYYVVPDCIDEMFGEDFDIASMLAEICPI